MSALAVTHETLPSGMDTTEEAELLLLEAGSTELNGERREKQAGSRQGHTSHSTNRKRRRTAETETRRMSLTAQIVLSIVGPTESTEGSVPAPYAHRI